MMSWWNQYVRDPKTGKWLPEPDTREEQEYERLRLERLAVQERDVMITVSKDPKTGEWVRTLQER